MKKKFQVTGTKINVFQFTLLMYNDNMPKKFWQLRIYIFLYIAILMQTRNSKNNKVTKKV